MDEEPKPNNPVVKCPKCRAQPFYPCTVYDSFTKQRLPIIPDHDERFEAARLWFAKGG